jgi:hypothetical protein
MAQRDTQAPIRCFKSNTSMGKKVTVRNKFLDIIAENSFSGESTMFFRIRKRIGKELGKINK